MLHYTARAAADPSTPTPKLRELLPNFPDEVLANPAWLLAEAAEPHFLRSLDSRQWSAIVESRRANPELLRLALRACDEQRAYAWQFSSNEVKLALVLRSEVSREVLEQIARPWRAEIVNEPEVEIAMHRLGLPEGSTDGWRAVLPVAYRYSRSVDRSKRHKGWELVYAMLRDRELHPAAPALEYLPTCVPSVAAYPIALAAEVPSSALIDVLAYVLMSRCRSRYIDLGVMLTRSMLRRWEGGGELGQMPARCEAAPIGGNRTRDPWPSERNRMRNVISRIAERFRDAPPVRSLPEAGARTMATDWVHRSYVSSTRCEPEFTEWAAEDRRWVDRLAAASNPMLPVALRAELAQDRHWLVRAAALESWVIP